MIDVVSVHLMRESDNKTISKGIPATKLIYNAAVCLSKCYEYNGKTLIACGKGNNAADGYALAVILKKEKKNVEILACEDEFSDGGLFFYNEAISLGVVVHKYSDGFTFNKYVNIVDCIFGTGFHGSVNEYYSNIINSLNSSGAFIISADINSGLNGNNGLADIAVKSNITVSFGAYKYGHFLNQAKDYIGRLECCDVGIELIEHESYLLDDSDIKEFLKPRLNYSNKGTYGYVGIMGGSSNYPGAVRLASLGQNALYSGAGVSRVIVPKAIANDVRANVLEATVYPYSSNNNGNFVFDKAELSKAIKGLKALGIGIGIGQSNEIVHIISYLLDNFDGTLIIDADALNCLSKMDLNLLNTSKARVVLTPHLKELSRLTGYTVDEIRANIISIGKEFVKKYNVCLLVKGPTTTVFYKECVYLINRGSPGMATAGSGDVLTGILTGIMGYTNSDIGLSTAVGAYINGASGELASNEYGDYGMVASDTARMVSKVFRAYTKE